MEEFKNIPSELVITILIGVLGLLLSFIGYLAKEFLKELKSLKAVLIELQAAMREEKMFTLGWRESLKDKHAIIDKRLDSHGKRLDMHEISIATIKSKME